MPLVMMGVVGTLSYNFQTVFPLFTTRDLHGTGTTFTVLFSVVSVGALVGALRASRDERRSASARSRWRRWVTASRSPLMAFAPNQAIAYVLGLGARPHEHRVPDRVDGDRADRVGIRRCAAECLRSRRCCSSAARRSARPIVGFVSQEWGARYGIGLGAVAALLAGAWGLARCRRMRTEETVGDDDVEAAVAESVSELSGAEP